MQLKYSTFVFQLLILDAKVYFIIKLNMFIMRRLNVKLPILLCLGLQFFTFKLLNAQGSGDALDFDGTNDYVSCGSFDPPSQGTVEFWIKADAAGGDRPMGSEDAFECRIKNLNSGYKMTHHFFHDGSGTLKSSTELAFGQWYHIACTWDYSTNDAEIYINGVSDVTGSQADFDPGTDNFSIGDRTGKGDYFNGRLDEVRIWDVVRTSTQIKDGMTLKLDPANQSNLVAYWRLDDGSGTTAADDAGSHSGTLNNFALSGSSSNWVTSGAPLGDASIYLYTSG